jgi:hypothetical protein
MIPYLDDLAMARGGATGAAVMPDGGGPPPTNPRTFFTSPDEKDLALRWLLGITGTWIILTLMVDLGEPAELAVAFAIVIMGSVLLGYGPKVFDSLGLSGQPPQSKGQ